MEEEEEVEKDEKDEKQSRATTSSVLASGAMYNALANGARSLVPFCVNLLVARRLSPERYGLPAVHFHLVTQAVLQLGREGVRRACMRHVSEDASGTVLEHRTSSGDGASATGQTLRAKATRRMTTRSRSRAAAEDGGGGAADAARRNKEMDEEQTRRNLRFEEQKKVAKKNRIRNYQIIINISWLSFPISVFIACVACACFAILHRREDDTSSSDAPRNYCLGFCDEYTYAIVLQGVAAVIEIACEPMTALTKYKLEFWVMAIAEPAASLAGAATTYALLVTTGPDATIFGYARIATACVNLIVYFIHFMLSNANVAGDAIGGLTQLLPRFIEVCADTDKDTSIERRNSKTKKMTTQEHSTTKDRFLFDRRLLRLSYDYGIQAAEKFVLGEGEKMVLASMASGYNQGVFGLVSNLGSLVVRLVFFPLEQAAFLAFGMSGGAAAAASGSDIAADDADGHKRRDAYEVLVQSTKIGILVATLFLCFGPPYSYTLIRIMYSTRWSETEASDVLALYCNYVALLAVNGITEAFVHATASSAELRDSNTWMLLVSFISVSTSIGLISTGGASGLILSNCVNMLLRIGYSIRYILRYRARFLDASTSPSLWASLPSRMTCTALVLVRIVSTFSNAFILKRADDQFLVSAIAHIGVGAVGLCAVVMAVLLTDAAMRRYVVAAASARKLSKIKTS